MSRVFDSINVNKSINIGPVSILSDNGQVLVESSGTTFPITSNSIIGSIGSTGSSGLIGPTGTSLSIEVISGSSSIINPNVNISILSAGTTYTLSNPSSNGALKYIVDDVNRSIYPSPTVTVNGNFYSSSNLLFYTSIRTVASNAGRSQGLVYLDDIGAWSIVNNAEIFTYVA